MPTSVRVTFWSRSVLALVVLAANIGGPLPIVRAGQGSVGSSGAEGSDPNGDPGPALTPVGRRKTSGHSSVSPRAVVTRVDPVRNPADSRHTRLHRRTPLTALGFVRSRAAAPSTALLSRLTPSDRRAPPRLSVLRGTRDSAVPNGLRRRSRRPPGVTTELSSLPGSPRSGSVIPADSSSEGSDRSCWSPCQEPPAPLAQERWFSNA